MAKTEMLIQGSVGTIGRRCIVCGTRWDAKHPNDVNTLLIGNIIHDVYPIDDGKGPTELQRAEMLHKVLDLFDDKCPFDLINQADAEEALREKQEKRDVIEVGDIVEDCTGNRCTVTNTDTHIHVVYENGKTHKWDKDAVFLKVGKAKMMEIVEE